MRKKNVSFLQLHTSRSLAKLSTSIDETFSENTNTKKKRKMICQTSSVKRSPCIHQGYQRLLRGIHVHSSYRSYNFRVERLSFSRFFQGSMKSAYGIDLTFFSFSFGQLHKTLMLQFSSTVFDSLNIKVTIYNLYCSQSHRQY